MHTPMNEGDLWSRIHSTYKTDVKKEKRKKKSEKNERREDGGEGKKEGELREDVW